MPMRRSELNRLIREAEAFFAEYRFALPRWAGWPPDRWAADSSLAAYCQAHQMGWDVTDFGSGRFDERGLLLFCLRNGIQNQPDERPYAEKLLVVREGQETPWHFHRVKMEDIIVRGGGTLVVEVQNTDAAGQPTTDPVFVACDGERRILAPREQLRLQAGQSITMHRGLAHRFHGEPGSGVVLVGEVSQVNDDHHDNYFLEPVGRFAAIEEDEAPERLLWSELTTGSVRGR
jgi:D-lyxose ketol-isomerase